VYAEKIWRQLGREALPVGRDRVARLMRELGIAGVVRGAKRRTTTPAQETGRPADLVCRDFSASAPNRLWVADLTYVATWAGFCYAAFIIDAYSRAIVGWRVATTLRATLALDALEMAIWTRQDTPLDGLIHHSDRGVQGEIKRSSQHLDDEELRCGNPDGDGRIWRVGRRCGRRDGRQWRGVRISNGSGRPSPEDCRVRPPRCRVACRRPWGCGGFVTVAACRRSASPRYRGATCHSPSARRSRS
jgi:putative transposase